MTEDEIRAAAADLLTSIADAEIREAAQDELPIAPITRRGDRVGIVLEALAGREAEGLVTERGSMRIGVAGSAEMLDDLLEAG